MHPTNQFTATYSAEKGRMLVATSLISTGSLVATETPVAYTLTVRLGAKGIDEGIRCSRCFTSPNSNSNANGKVLRCGACKGVFYCDTRCQRSDWALHKSECKVRILVAQTQTRKALAGQPDQHEPSKQPEQLDQSAQSAFLAARALPSLANECVERLTTNRACFDESVLIRFGQTALLLSAALAPLQRSPDILVSLQCALACNAVGIVDPVHQRDCGVGIFPAIIALANHSCVPNCAVAFEPVTHMARLVSLRDIQEGEELTVSYVDSADPYHSRRLDLQRRYFFTCKCELCIKQAATLVTRETCTNIVGWDTLQSLQQQTNELQSICILQNILSLQCQIYGSPSPESLATRQKLYDAALANQDWRNALNLCRDMIFSMETLYPPRSPNLGLQYLSFTRLSLLVMENVGARQTLLEDLKEILQCVDKSLVILNALLGNGHPLVEEAREKKGEVVEIMMMHR